MKENKLNCLSADEIMKICTEFENFEDKFKIVIKKYKNVDNKLTKIYNYFKNNKKVEFISIIGKNTDLCLLQYALKIDDKTDVHFAVNFLGNGKFEKEFGIIHDDIKIKTSINRIKSFVKNKFQKMRIEYDKKCKMIEKLQGETYDMQEGLDDFDYLKEVLEIY